MQAARILVVDDEPGIRETLPRILGLHGFDVTSRGTVAEAIAEISSSKFDVLISDLNIGEPGDGFTVVSAMRRTQPNCFTFILTGYPAFETALQAIRSQVDDYLIKPAPITDLVEAIQRKLTSAKSKPRHVIATKRISQVIRENVTEIVRRTLEAIKTESAFEELHLTDEQRVFPYAPLLAELADLLDSSGSHTIHQRSMRTAALRGEVRRAQGYSIPLMVASTRLLEDAVFEVVAENLLVLDISSVISDLRQLSGNLARQLEESIKAYQQAGRRLVFDRSERWRGWFCERCCWNRPEPATESDRLALAARINADFDTHSCELFVRQHRRVRANPRQST